MKKKSLLLLALSAMVIGGCSKSEIDDGSINSTNAITFETSANKLTKAAALSNDNATDFEFGVYAYQTGQSDWSSASTQTEFMVNQMVDNVDGAWTYTPMKYWPNSSGEKISFFAYMPYSAETVASIPENSTLPQLVFSQIMDAEDMLDLTVAKALNQEKSTSAVVLPFEHVTTRLNFSAKVDHDLTTDLGNTSSTTYVYVTGLRVLGSNNNSDSKLYSKATYIMSDTEGNNGDWDYTTTTVPTADLDVTPILNTSDWNVGSPVITLSSVRLGQTTTATSLLTSGQYLFLIPVDGDNGVSAETDIQLEVDYSIVTADETLAEKIAKSDATATMSLPNGTLKEGVAYNIVMTIGVDKVIVDAEPIADWSTDETIYTESKVTTADAIVDALTEAFTAGQESVTVTYEGSDEALAITIPDAASNPDMSITLDLSNVTGDITITTDSNYTGALYINAPNAEVTLDGTTYTGLTAATKANTLIIPAGTTVNGLTINAGNVVVYGELNGTIYAGTNLESSIVTIMSGATNNATNNAPSKITVSTLAKGVYYSVDNSTSSTDFDNIPDGTAIKVITNNESLTVAQITSIATKDFEQVDFEYATYESTIFPNKFQAGTVTVTTGIGDVYTEATSRKLRHITLPSNITSLAESAFTGCTKLESVDIPVGLVTFGNRVFQECSSLKKFILNPNTTLGDCSFKNCTSLTYVNIENVTTFNAITSNGTVGTFRDCINLEGEVVFNDDVTVLNSHILRGCSKVEKVTLPSKLETLGIYALGYCTNLKEVVIPDEVKNNTDLTVGTYIFRGTSIEMHEWPFSTTDIPASAFYLCNIGEFDFTDITSIGQSAFNNCNLSGELDLPESLINIGNYAFAVNKNLTKITFPEIETTIPIGTGAFSSEGLEEITLPKSFTFTEGSTTLEGRAFRLCINLHTIVCPSETIPVAYAQEFGSVEASGYNSLVGANVPEGTDKILYVPAESVDAYKAETIDGAENYWKTVLIDKCGFKVEAIPAE